MLRNIKTFRNIGIFMGLEHMNTPLFLQNTRNSEKMHLIG